MTQPSPTLESLAADLAAGRTTARALTEACLARIEDPAGEGSRAFIAVDRAAALAAADGQDALRRAGAAPSRFSGIPVSVKDLFDIAGQVTRAGSTVLADQPPAGRDAPAVARLRGAGFVVIGRTNMTEFAYSGLGLNPHYGTPKSPWQREVGHVPGGSSSGAAVSVADGMAHAGLGTDTGGSCRIPAAFCGITGFKPTATRVPRQGGVPLSTTLDSFGPLARTVACCAAVDAVLAALKPDPLPAVPLAGLRLAVPQDIVLDDMEAGVAAAFGRALATLSAAGAQITEIAVPEFAAVAGLNARGGLAAAESFAWHRPHLARNRGGYDPRVAVRIGRGEALSAADYIDLLAIRADLVAGAARRLDGYDAALFPTVPMAPPAIAPLEADDDLYGRVNLLALRNSTMINVIDGCAVSLPMHRPGEAPAGLTLASLAGRDRRLLGVAQSVEAALR
jgi:aspartyl-tRNA(Asn)/glutamyl-tRNA(Gln) amidotransferase subunit A